MSGALQGKVAIITGAGSGIGRASAIRFAADGSAKGGVAIAIEKETGLPIKFIGTGESLSDLAPFDAASYLESLFL